MSRDPEHVLGDAQEAAGRAERAMGSPGLREAFERLEALYVERIRRSAPEDVEGREANYNMLRALDALRDDLTAVSRGAEVVRRNFRNTLRNRGQG